MSISSSRLEQMILKNDLKMLLRKLANQKNKTLKGLKALRFFSFFAFR
jgi:hypothetical protein